jgi:hypothetical protein
MRNVRFGFILLWRPLGTHTLSLSLYFYDTRSVLSSCEYLDIGFEIED